MPHAPAASKTLTPGKVLILLAGKFRGKRVVLLKQLPSGLLLVSGPHKINGVPLRRVNPAYVLATSAVVPLNGVKRGCRGRPVLQEGAAPGQEVGGELQERRPRGKSALTQFTEEQKKSNEARAAQNKTTQKSVDSALLASIKGVEFLRRYLSARFTLYNNTRPHELTF